MILSISCLIRDRIGIFLQKKANSSSPSAEKGQKEGNEVLKNVKEETVLDEAADVDNNNGGGGSDDNNDSDQESDDEYSAGV